MSFIFIQQLQIKRSRYRGIVKEPSSLLKEYEEKGLLNPKIALIILNLYDSYMQAIQHTPMRKEEGHHLFKQLVELIIQQVKTPYKFDIFHSSLRKPFDYYQFGLDFIRPLVNFTQSQVLGLEYVEQINTQIARGENVILLANHQTEPDPQLISLLLESRYAFLASQMIFVAGHRVIEDPMAIPMSLGRHLLCIYSKKYIDHPAADRPKKVSHNQRTMKKMSELLKEGGKCIYVAPSGGRDRPNAEGLIYPAPFDADSLEMFWLMAQQANHPTHFYPLSLFTYHVMPPPLQIAKEIGEKREVAHVPVYLAFGSEVDLEQFPESHLLNKKLKRLKRAEYIWNLVYQDYNKLLGLFKKVEPVTVV